MASCPWRSCGDRARGSGDCLCGLASAVRYSEPAFRRSRRHLTAGSRSGRSRRWLWPRMAHESPTSLRSRPREKEREVYLSFTICGAASPQPFQATIGGSFPFWSPDGRFVAFFSGGQLKRVETAGGAVRTISDAPSQPAGGSWSGDGVILMGSAEGPVSRVSAEGGTLSALTAIGDASGHTHPEFLPDGRHFLFVIVAAGGTRSLAVGTIDDDTVVDLGPSESKAAYATPYLLRVRNGELVADRFDISTLRLAGEPIVVTSGVAVSPSGSGAFTIAGHTLVYRRTVRASPTQLTWVDRTGAPLGTIGEPDDQMQVQLSRDVTRAAVSVFDPVRTTRDIWMYDLARNVRSRFTFEGGDAFSFAWSPDGTQLVYSAVRPPSSLLDLFIRPVDGVAAEQRVLKQAGTGNRYVQAWSARNASLIFGTGTSGSATGNDIWIASLDGSQTPQALVQTPANERAGNLSPDGRWLAYRIERIRPLRDTRQDDRWR